MANSACAVSEFSDVTTGYLLQCAILLFTFDCKTSKMEGEDKSENRRRKLAHSTVLQMAK